MVLSLLPVGGFGGCSILNGSCHELRFFLMPNVAFMVVSEFV